MLTIGASAQVKFGPKVGLNLSNLTGDVDGSETLTGFSIGAVAEVGLASNWYFQPGLQFSTKGAKYDLDYLGDAKLKLNYIEVPVNFGYKINVGPANILAFAGPYLAYGVGGNLEDEDVEWGSSKGELNPFDLGLNIGAGLEIDNLQIGLQYGFGLSNMSNVSDFTQKNGVFSATIAYYLF